MSAREGKDRILLAASLLAASLIGAWLLTRSGESPPVPTSSGGQERPEAPEPRGRAEADGRRPDEEAPQKREAEGAERPAPVDPLELARLVHRAFFEEGNAGKVGEILSSLLKNPDDVLRLVQLLTEGGLGEKDEEALVFTVGQALRFYAEAARKGMLEQLVGRPFGLADFFHRLLALASALSERAAIALLRVAEAEGILDLSHLPALEPLLQKEGLRAEIAKIMMAAAARFDPEGADVFARFLNEENLKLRIKALEHLIRRDPETYLPLARKRYFSAPPASEEAKEVAALIAHAAPPEQVFPALREIVTSLTRRTLIHPVTLYMTLEDRGLAERAEEEFYLERDPKVRALLVNAAASREGLLQYAAEADPDPDVRSEALLQLGNTRRDVRTGEMILRALEGSDFRQVHGALIAAGSFLSWAPKAIKTSDLATSIRRRAADLARNPPPPPHPSAEAAFVRQAEEVAASVPKDE